MSEYTLKQCKEDMIILWGHLATAPTSMKSSLRHVNPDVWYRIGFMHNTCPCCEYAGLIEKDSKRYNENHTAGKINCERCPCWPNSDYGCEDISFNSVAREYRIGEYTEWKEANTTVMLNYWANKILIRALMIKTNQEDGK